MPSYPAVLSALNEPLLKEVPRYKRTRKATPMTTTKSIRRWPRIRSGTVIVSAVIIAARTALFLELARMGSRFVQALRNLYDPKPMRVRNSIGWIAPRNQSPEQTHSSEHCVDVVEEYNRTGRQKVSEGIKIRDDSFD